MLTCAAAIALAAVNAAPAQLEHLGQPCRAKNILAGRVIRDRADGRERLVLTNMNEDTGCELLYIDFEKNTGKVYHAPAGAGSWALNEVPGDRLIVGTFYDGAFMVFDLRKMEFIKVAKFPGESYIWNLAMGSDGRIYGGSYGNGKLGALDLTTYEVEDCGAPAPPNLYLRYVSALPDGRVFCQFGTEKPTRMVFDPSTRKFEPAPEGLAGMDTGVSWNGYFLAGSKCFDGKTLKPVDPPFPAPDSAKGTWYVLPRLTTGQALYLQQGPTVFRFSPGDKQLTTVISFGTRAGFQGVSRKGELLVVRGQDYAVIEPGAKDLSLKPIPVESGPRPSLFLKVDAQGRVWGGPHFGQTLFWFDPKTGKTVNTGAICDSGGEVYDVTFKDGTVYAVAYAGGDIVVYDPAKPWDQWNDKNPKLFSDVGGRGYIRPIAGVTVGEDGKLYSGWMIKYGAYGGAVAITDTATGVTDLIENPLGEQAVQGVIPHGGLLYIGSSLGANGLPNKTGEPAKFGVLDVATRKLVYEKAFDGVGHVRVLGYDAKANRVVVSAGGKLRLFDPDKREFAADLAGDVPTLGCNSVTVANGKLYYANDKTVLALDLASGTVESIAEAPAKVSNVALSPDGKLYLTSGVDLYGVRVAK